MVHHISSFHCDRFLTCNSSSCSLPLFAVRAAVQSVLFTPKAPPFEPRRNQPFLNGIILSNLICMLLHAFLINPEAGESTRGYLHGGLFIDLIGQRPVSVLRLLLFDLLIFFVDIILLALTIERVKTLASTPSAPTEPTSTSNTNTETETATQSQDHDAEERGVLRQEDGDEAIPHESAASSPNSSVDDEVDEERANLLADPTDIESPILARGGHPMDTFAAGEHVVVNASFPGTLVDQWRYSRDLVRQTPAFPPAETATFIRQRFGLQVGANGRFERVDDT